MGHYLKNSGGFQGRTNSAPLDLVMDLFHWAGWLYPATHSMYQLACPAKPRGSDLNVSCNFRLEFPQIGVKDEDLSNNKKQTLSADVDHPRKNLRYATAKP
jgi:hypothetical protein